MRPTYEPDRRSGEGGHPPRGALRGTARPPPQSPPSMNMPTTSSPASDLVRRLVAALRSELPRCMGASRPNLGPYDRVEEHPPHPATRSSYDSVDEGCLRCQGMFGCEAHPYWGHFGDRTVEEDADLTEKVKLVEEAERFLREKIGA